MRFPNKLLSKYVLASYLALLFLLIISLSSNAQLTEKQLKSLFKKHDNKALEQIFIAEYEKTKAEADRVLINDTLLNINKLYNIILSECTGNGSKTYFILQNAPPSVFVDTCLIKISPPFIASMADTNIKAIKFDNALIINLTSFMGNKSHKKRSFISQFLKIGSHWGSTNIILVPYHLKFIRFNSDMTFARLEYDFTWCGAIEEYTLEKGKWVKTNVILDWTE